MRLPLIIILLIAVLGGVWLWQRSSPDSLPAAGVAATPSATDAFTVILDPMVAGAEVWFGPHAAMAVPANGRLSFADLPAGDHDLVVRAPGHLPYASREPVGGGSPTTTTVSLVAARGSLAVTAQPGTAIIVQDEAGETTALGTVPTTGTLTSAGLLPLGTYTVRLTHADYAPVSLEATLRDAKPVPLRPTQSPLPGELQVLSRPTGATVSINGEVRGPTPLVLTELPSQVKLRVTVELAGHEIVEEHVQVPPRASHTLDVGQLALARGEVALQLQPSGLSWSQVNVEVDGRGHRAEQTGDTWHLAGVAVGARQITLRHPDYEIWQATLDVTAHETTKAEVALAPKPARLRLEGGPADRSVSLDGHLVYETDGVVTLPADREVRLTVIAPRHHPQSRVFAFGANASATWTLDLPRQLEPLPDQSHENSLGMRFVSIPDSNVLYSIWETRERDYAAFVAATGHDWSNPGHGPDHPAVNVSWHDAQAFCRWLTQTERAEGWLKPHQRYRLPTDAEWSLAVGLPHETGDHPAAKDGKIRNHFPWGSTWQPYGSGNYRKEWELDYYDETSPVGSFMRNINGLFDLGGNAWEWVEDEWRPGTGLRVLRGGSYTHPDKDHIIPNPYRYYDMAEQVIGADQFYSSIRISRTPGNPREDIGFRVVLEVE